MDRLESEVVLAVCRMISAADLSREERAAIAGRLLSALGPGALAEVRADLDAAERLCLIDSSAGPISGNVA